VRVFAYTNKDICGTKEVHFWVSVVAKEITSEHWEWFVLGKRDRISQWFLSRSGHNDITSSKRLYVNGAINTPKAPNVAEIDPQWSTSSDYFVHNLTFAIDSKVLT
jgi:hypothetical protein